MTNLPRMQLHIGPHTLWARVARTDEERALGLMHRQSLDPDEGMLFMCDAPGPQSFWMKDTHVALTAAFLEDDGTIVQLADMQPRNDECACDTHVRFILEVPQGWFAERGIAEGERIDGAVFLPARVEADAADDGAAEAESSDDSVQPRQAGITPTSAAAA